MKIRQLEEKDFESAKLIKPSITKKTFDERTKRQSEKKVEFLILEDNNNPISFVLLKWQGKPTHTEYPDIEDLYTREEFRGRGWGSLLLKECEKKAKEKGFNKIGLAVNPTENSKAKSLYKKLGFKQGGDKSYLDGLYNGVEDWVVDMEKEI